MQFYINKNVSLGVLSVFCSTLFLGNADGAKSPEWLTPLLSIESSAAVEKEGAYVLLDEDHYDFNERGTVRVECRYAVKILDKKQRDEAAVSIPFEEGLSEVTHFRAWMVDPQGKVYKYEKKETWDVTSDTSSLHSRRMSKNFDLSKDVREGCVFAYEYDLKRKTVFSQLIKGLSGSVPVLKSVISVVPPKGWSVEAVALSGAEATASRNGEAYVWTATDLKPVEVEDGGPVAAYIAPKLGIDLRPSENSDRSYLQAFSGWGEIAAHDADVNDRQIEPNGAIRDKVNELVAGAESEWEKMAAIARYAQSVNYVAINTNLSLGGGYEPFKASEVFERHYGDCKDKTALTRSMLKCLGKDSYAVSAYVGPGAYVDPKWPSMYQFDHCIVAIPVGPDVESEAVVEDASLGRVMLFDPTSELAPFGKLPSSVHGSRVLIGSDRVEALTSVPYLQPEVNRIERVVSVNLASTGEAVGTILETSHGSHALRERSAFRRCTETEYKEMLVRWISQAGSNAKVESFDFEDRFEPNETELKVSFYASAFGRSMRGKFLVFKPFQLSQIETPAEKLDERKQPYVFLPSSKAETLEVSGPEGFVVDDFMKPVLIENDFARYEAKLEDVDGVLRCQREVVYRQSSVPVERYGEVLDFFEKVARAEQTPAVFALAR